MLSNMTMAGWAVVPVQVRLAGKAAGEALRPVHFSIEQAVLAAAEGLRRVMTSTLRLPQAST